MLAAKKDLPVQPFPTPIAHIFEDWDGREETRGSVTRFRLGTTERDDIDRLII
jgi:hypothetical protein